jgi:FkbM family methyltransferase
MNHPLTIHLRRLSFGALCIEGDCNQPVRSEAMQTLDIDGEMPRVAKAINLQPGDVCVDAGAFVGDTALALAREGAEVYAFEPFFDAYVCAVFNNRHSLNVHVYNEPTGNGERVKLVYECPGPNFGMRSVTPDDGPDSEPTARIDDLQLRSCKLMKIDVEGREIPTLQGAAETIKRCRPFIFIEHYPDGLLKAGFTGEQLIETLESFGYDLEMWGEPPRWDWLCRPKEMAK